MVSSESLHVAIIGCGRIAGGYDDKESPQVHTHAKAYLLNDQTELFAVVDKDEQRAKDFSMRWGNPTIYTNAPEMLTAESPEIVSICTPTDTHAEMLELCLDFPSVKAVWAEKPLASDIDRAEKIVDLYLQRNKILAVNYQRRWDPEMQRVKRAINKQELGKIQKVVVYYSKGLQNNGSHAIDLILDWFGELSEFIVLGSLVDFSEDDPTIDVLLRFSEIEVFFIGVDSRNFGLFEIHIFGEHGRINITKFGREIEWIRRLEISEFEGYHELNPLGKIYKSKSSKVMACVLEEIVTSIYSEIPVRSNGDTALTTLKVCAEISRQSKELRLLSR